jgi:predicted component of type VI protein secretion system
VIIDILAKARSVDEIVTINNEVVGMLEKCAALIKKFGNNQKAHRELKKIIKDFKARHNVSGESSSHGNAFLDKVFYDMPE